MKIVKTKLILMLLLLPIVMLAANTRPTGKHTKEKSIHKEFTVNSNTKLLMRSLYGNIDMTAWDGDKIIIDVQVSVNGNEEQKVIAGLKQVNPVFKLDTKKNILHVWTEGTKDLKMHKELNFQIKIPRSNSLDIYNQFGNIAIDETEANADLMVNYGNIIAGKLKGSKTKLFFGYSQLSTIDYVKDVYVWGSFSDWEIKKAGNIELDGLHSSNSIIREVNNINYKKCTYGTLRINKVLNSINGDGDYLTTRIDDLQGNIATIKSEFGGVEINKWDANKLNFDIHQAKLSLGYDNEKSFNLNLFVNSCADFTRTVTGTMPQSFVQYKNEKDKKYQYRYYHLEKSNEKQVKIEMTKGILRFNKVSDVLAEK